MLGFKTADKGKDTEDTKQNPNFCGIHLMLTIKMERKNQTKIILCLNTPCNQTKCTRTNFYWIMIISFGTQLCSCIMQVLYVVAQNSD